MQSQVLKTFLIVVITAVVVGGGVYYWQQNKVAETAKLNQETNNQIADKKTDETVTPTPVAEDGTVTDNSNQIPEPTANKPSMPSTANNGIATEQPAVSGEKYTSNDLNYELIIPEKWKSYNYKVTYKYYSKGDAENEDGTEKYEDIYTADFSDWPSFELLRIGSMPSAVWYADLNNYEEAMQADPDGELMKPLYLQNKIGEIGTGPLAKVYYAVITRQDAPQQFIDDGEPMPDLTKNFKIISN